MFIESFDGTKIYYRLKKGRKRKPCLVFLHGWAGNWTIWKKEINFFNKKGYSTLTLDLRGHGQSEIPRERKSYKVKYFAKDINEILKKEKIKEIYLLGHSLGGLLSLVFYDMFKRKVKALVLCSTSSGNVLEHKTVRFFYPTIRFLVTGLAKFSKFISSSSGLDKKPFKKCNDIDLSSFNGWPDWLIFLKEWVFRVPMISFLSTFDMMERCNEDKVLKKIKVPTLIIVGSEDWATPEIYSYEMFKEIKNDELDIIYGGTHYVVVEYPRKVDKYIFNFLNRLK